MKNFQIYYEKSFSLNFTQNIKNKTCLDLIIKENKKLYMYFQQTLGNLFRSVIEKHMKEALQNLQEIMSDGNFCPNIFI